MFILPLGLFLNRFTIANNIVALLLEKMAPQIYYSNQAFSVHKSKRILTFKRATAITNELNLDVHFIDLVYNFLKL